MPRRRASVLLLLTIGAVAACDTGDGKTLDPPTAPLPTTTTSSTVVPTVPPIETAGTATLPQEAATTAPFTVPFEVYAPWAEGAEIPAVHTCAGADEAPTITWAGVPDGTRELALVMTDIDLIASENGPFVHWLVTGIDPADSSITGGATRPGVTEWENSFGEVGWGGPCPPAGSEHRYLLTLHALNQPLAVADDSSTADVVGLVEAASAGSATVLGTSRG